MEKKLGEKNILIGQHYEIDIFDLNQHGQGVGKIDSLIVFVDNAIIGDRVEVVIKLIKKHYAIAETSKLIKESESRIQSPCPVSEFCGGCSVLSMDYNSQIMWKKKRISDCLTKSGLDIGLIPEIRPVKGMAQPFYYRSKVQMPVSGSCENPQIGFFAKRSHQIVDSSICKIQHPVADIIRETVRSFIKKYKISPYNEETHSGLLRHIVVRVGFYTGQVMVVLVINGDKIPHIEKLADELEIAVGLFDRAGSNSQLSDDISSKYELTSLFLNINKQKNNLILTPVNILIKGKEYIEDIVLGLRYRISPMAFFQVNPQQTNILYGQVLELAELNGTQTVLDLYCGTGSISLLLAKKSAKVIGVEIVKQAIEDAKINAKENDLKNVEFIAAEAEHWLPEYISTGGFCDLAVIDPPRKGCDKKLLSSLLEAEIKSLIYVSCNPATLARDLQILSEKYKIITIQPVDMFPHSDHVETVVLMSRVKVNTMF